MFSPTAGTSRFQLEKLPPDRIRQMQDTGTLILDDRRRRSRFFDGRFLTASDLTRDQNYFLTRQADLAKSGGFGIVQGLVVSALPGSANQLRISPGHGVTPQGELVVIQTTHVVKINDIPETQRLAAAFGIQPLPSDPPRNRSGLFVLALRPVEFSANPIAAYPTEITGTRSLQHGDIVEAVAITLIPYPVQADGTDQSQRRRKVAREVFVEGSTRGIPSEALPLAMVALERGVIRWVDPHLVRREVGTEYDDLLQLDTTPRALREAHFLQHEQHLQDVLKERDHSRRPRRFSATEHFQALPAVGRLPAAAIDPQDFTQVYFPAEVDVELSFIPSDEVAALLDESLILPPIDLQLSGEELDATAVMVLIPVHRQRLQQLQSALADAQRQGLSVGLTRKLAAIAPGLLSKRRPIETLRSLRLPPITAPLVPPAPIVPVNPQELIDAEWRKALSNTDLLWYVRRRNLPYRADAGVATARGLRNEYPDNQKLFQQLQQWNLERRFYTMVHFSSWQANGELADLLSAAKIVQSRLLVESIFAELEAKRRELDQLGRRPDADLQRRLHPNEELGRDGRLTRYNLRQLAERYGDPQFGEGLARLESVNAEIKNNVTVQIALAQSLTVPELERLSRLLEGDSLRRMATELESLAKSTATDRPTRIRQFILSNLEEVES